MIFSRSEADSFFFQIALNFGMPLDDGHSGEERRFDKAAHIAVFEFVDLNSGSLCFAEFRIF